MSRIRPDEHHLIRRADCRARHRPFGSLSPAAAASAQARTAVSRVVDQKALGIIVTVEFAGQFAQIRGDQMRREFARSYRELRGKRREAAQQRFLVGARERRKIRIANASTICGGHRDPRLLHHRCHARMRVLDVVDRILLGLRLARGRCRRRTRVSALRESEEEAHGVAADLVDPVRAA